MNWINATLLLALTHSFKSINDKILLSHYKIDTLVVGYWTCLVPALVFGIVTLTQSEQVFTVSFLIATLLAVILNVIGILSRLTAIKHYDITFIEPIASLEPLFVALFGFIILHESLTFFDLIGIVIIIIGCLILEKTQVEAKRLRNIKDIKRSGWFLMLLNVSCYALATPISKIAILESGIAPYLFLRYVLMALIFFIFSKIYSTLNNTISSVTVLNPRLALSGILLSIVVFLEMYAYTQTNVSYVASVRKMNLVFVFILEWMLLNQTLKPKRIAATFIIILGILIIIQ